MRDKPLLRLEDIGLRIGEQTLLDGVELSLRPGEIMTVIGPNGAGKSTLVKIALGLLKPSQGRVLRAPGLRIGYMPQKLKLNPLMPLSVHRFLEMSCREPASIAGSLRRTGIANLLERDLQALSGGETQRVLLSRALLAQPGLLVLDEPAQGVDLSGQTELYELIVELRNELGCAVLMVSHDLHWVMAQTDTVICLNQHICCHGHPEQVSNDPAYRSLFGERHAGAVALYQHDHDHSHRIDGEPCEQHSHD